MLLISLIRPKPLTNVISRRLTPALIPLMKPPIFEHEFYESIIVFNLHKSSSAKSAMSAAHFFSSAEGALCTGRVRHFFVHFMMQFLLWRGQMAGKERKS